MVSRNNVQRSLFSDSTIFALGGLKSTEKKKGELGYDPLYKVRPLLDHLVAVFPIYYQPEQQLSIDEMMIGIQC